MVDSDKKMTAEEAVSKYIKPGTSIVHGGFSYTRRPNTFTREEVRQGLDGRIKDLFCYMNGGTTCEEFLASVDLIKKMETTYVGFEGLQPVAYSCRYAIENGIIDLFEDHSNHDFATRTAAGRYGLGFLPTGYAGFGGMLLEENYDVLGRAGMRGLREDGQWKDPVIAPKKYHIIDDPFMGFGMRPHAYRDRETDEVVGDDVANMSNWLEPTANKERFDACTRYTGNPGPKVVLWPPIMPEVGVVRTQRCGDEGTWRIDGLNGPCMDQFASAKIGVLEVEEVVDDDAMRLRPENNKGGGHQTDVIIEQPWGAHPCNNPYVYDYDWTFFLDYIKLNRNHDQMKDFWKDVVGEDDWEYLNKVGSQTKWFREWLVGMERMFALRADADYSYKPDLERPAK